MAWMKKIEPCLPRIADPSAVRAAVAGTTTPAARGHPTESGAYDSTDFCSDHHQMGAGFGTVDVNATTRAHGSAPWAMSSTAPSPLFMRPRNAVSAVVRSTQVVRRVAHVIAIACALLAQPMRADAQQPPKPSDCICSLSFAMVTIALVDAKGDSVHDATVHVRRVRTGTTRTAAADVPGAYTIADDRLRNSVRMDGEPFEVTVRWHGRTQRSTVTIGTRLPSTSGNNTASPANNCRCHVIRISGPEKLVLK